MMACRVILGKSVLGFHRILFGTRVQAAEFDSDRKTFTSSVGVLAQALYDVRGLFSRRNLFVVSDP